MEPEPAPTTPSEPSPSKKSLIPQLEDQLDIYLVQKAPFSLPTSAKEFIVNYGPWITLVLMLLALPAILAAIGLSSFYSSYIYAVNPKAGMTVTINLILAIVEIGLYGLALPGLFKKSKVGWNFLFYGILLSAVGYLVTFQLASLIIGTVLGLYILFQVKSYYK